MSSQVETKTAQDIRDAIQRVEDRCETDEAWERELDGLSGADLANQVLSMVRRELGVFP